MIKRFFSVFLAMSFILSSVSLAHGQIAALTWDGEWDTTFGRMTLKQEAIYVTGDYEKKAGRVSGVVGDDVLFGSWLQKPDYLPPINGGDFQIKMSDDGTKFEGFYKFGSAGQEYTFEGVRVKAKTTSMEIADGADNGKGVSSSEAVNQKKDRIVVVQLNNPYMLVNGEKTEMDGVYKTKPIVKDSRMLVPMRSIVEVMGGSLSWVNETKKMTITTDKVSIEMWVDKKTAFINGEKKNLEVAPTVINGRTMIPLKFLVENIPGYKMDWDAKTNSATIKY